MAFTLPNLPYDFAALEPAIDVATMQIHHGKHHQAYITNLNKALEGKPDLQSKSLQELIASIPSLPEAICPAVRNNGGGHWNHSFFWEILAPKSNTGQVSGELQKAIDAELGGLAKLKEAISAAGLGRFGSGWAWLCLKSDGKLCVCSSPNQDNPLMTGIAECPGQPILGVDVWEHAYYLKYQNRRADYLAAFWDVVNWTKVSQHYAAALAK